MKVNRSWIIYGRLSPNGTLVLPLFGGHLNYSAKSAWRWMADLVNLHIFDLQEVGKPIRQSKQAVLDALKRDIGATRISNLNRSEFIKYGKFRAKQGAGPVTLSIDLSHMHTVLTHAAAVHRITTSTEDLRLARTALTRLGLIGRSNERDRRPTGDEIDTLLNCFDNKTNTTRSEMRKLLFNSYISRLNW